MKTRIKKIRKEAHLTQKDFARQIGLKQNTIAAYEMGRIGVSDTVIISICREFGVNEKWLRTGEGEPYLQIQPDNLVATATSLLGRHDPIFEELIETYSKLDDIDKNVLLKVLQGLIATGNTKE